MDKFIVGRSLFLLRMGMSSILFIDAGGGLVAASPISILYIIIKIEICNRAFYGPTISFLDLMFQNRASFLFTQLTTIYLQPSR